MHELAIAGSIVDVATRHARGRPVVRVDVTVGHLRQVVPSALSFAFELVAKGTPVEGAELVMNMIPATVLCRTCGEESALDDWPLLCGSCESADVAVIAGDELLVESLDVDEQEVAHGRS